MTIKANFFQLKNKNNGEQNQEVKTSLFATTNKSKGMFAPLGKSNSNKDKEEKPKNRYAPLVKQNENKQKNAFALRMKVDIHIQKSNLMILGSQLTRKMILYQLHSKNQFFIQKERAIPVN